MSGKTKIGWTDKTWNPTTGCDRVSPGCDNCYALSTAKRNKAMHSPAYQVDGDPRTSGPGFALQMHEHRLADPLKWPDPQRIFVNSMSDLFHKQVTREFIAQVFAVMSMTPRHTYQILTKRHDRMRSLLNDSAFRGEVAAARLELAGSVTLDVRSYSETPEWPLPNVWLGVSVEDQKWANIRIPELIATPAAVRFLSCEPLLGPVNIAPLLPPIVPMQPEDAPAVWQDWTWDEWVPDAVRLAVQDFWPVSRGGPQGWLRDALDQGSHAYGQAVASFHEGILPPQRGFGRWVHAWGSVGRLVHPDRTYSYQSFTPIEVRKQRHFDWVIVGGESGHGARPMNPEWMRSLHKQAVDGGAAFFAKQLGSVLAKEWGATGKGEDPSEWQVPLPQEFPETSSLAEAAATLTTGATA